MVFIIEGVIDIVKEFEGLIGALAGAAVTFVGTVLIRKGKIRHYILENVVSYTHEYYDNSGFYNEIEITDDYAKANFLNLNIELEIFNGSEIPRILRDINFLFYKNNKVIYTEEPNESATRRRNQAKQIVVDKIEYINLAPKEIIRIKLDAQIPLENNQELTSFDEIYLEMKDHKGKRNKIKVQ